MSIELEPDHEAFMLAMIRQLPEANRDDAFKYVADRIRPIVEPTFIDVDIACREALRRYRDEFMARVVSLNPTRVAPDRVLSGSRSGVSFSTTQTN